MAGLRPFDKLRVTFTVMVSSSNHQGDNVMASPSMESGQALSDQGFRVKHGMTKEK